MFVNVYNTYLIGSYPLYGFPSAIPNFKDFIRISNSTYDPFFLYVPRSYPEFCMQRINYALVEPHSNTQSKYLAIAVPWWEGGAARIAPPLKCSARLSCPLLC